MDEALLLRRLSKPRFKEIVLLEETESTNSYAARMLAEERLRDGTVIIAERQTAGRGRFQRGWFSDGGLAMTAVMVEPLPPHLLGPVTLNAGVAVAKALSSFNNLHCGLKYPNDLMLPKASNQSNSALQKVGGILVEIKPAPGGTALLIGIGVNVEQERFPPELEQTATSLRLFGVTVPREELAAEILNQLAVWMPLPFCQVRGEWLKMDCTIGRHVAIRNPNLTVDGIAEGVDEDGALLVRTERGMQRITAGEIVFGE